MLYVTNNQVRRQEPPEDFPHDWIAVEEGQTFEIDGQSLTLLEAQKRLYKFELRNGEVFLFSKKRRKVYGPNVIEIPENEVTPEGYLDTPPEPSDDEKRKAEQARLDYEMDRIDIKLIRSLVEMADKTDTQQDRETFAQLKAEKEALRAERAAL